MEILAIAVGFLADANAARPPEHAIDLRHHPFRLLQDIRPWPSALVERHEKDDAERIRPQIA